MSHIVVYESADGASGFERCASLDAAIVAAERLRNVEGVASPRIFKLEEVKFDFRPYFRIEVDEAESSSSPVVERTVIPEPPTSVMSAVAAPAAEVAEPLGADAEPTADDEPSDDALDPSDPFAGLEDLGVETADEVDETDEAAEPGSVFEPEAELEAIFAPESDPEPVPENTGEALFDSLQEESTEWAGSDAAGGADGASEDAVVDMPEPDSMTNVRKGLFGR